MKWILLLAAMLAFATSVEAQGKIFHPEKFERATKEGAGGKIEWADHEGAACPNCKGTGKHNCVTCERYPDEATKCPDCGPIKKGQKKRIASCDACVGTGKFPDPLEQAPCPGCMGAGYIVCGSCPGSGILKVGTGAKRWSNCVGCRGDGSFQCQMCKGKRFVGTPKLKPSLKDANSETLKKALATTDKALTALMAFTPKAKKTRKELKEFSKAIKLGEKVFPVLKLSGKLVKQKMKWVYAGSSFQGQGEREMAAMTQLKATHENYLKHQRRMMELALKRAEANEKLAGK